MNEMNELLLDHRHIEVRKKQKRDYARKKRATERALRDKFPLMEAEMAALQEQNEQLRTQLQDLQAIAHHEPDAHQLSSSHGPQDDLTKLDAAMQSLTAMGVQLNHLTTRTTIAPSTATSPRQQLRKRGGRPRKVDTVLVEPPRSSSPLSDENAMASVGVTPQGLQKAVANVASVLLEAQAAAVQQLASLQSLVDSPSLQALAVMAAHLHAYQSQSQNQNPSSKQLGKLDGVSACSAEDVMRTVRDAQYQLESAVRSYMGITQRSFSHLFSTLSPHQLAQGFSNVMTSSL